jgi:DNA-3-methyladenine glycosylase I
MEYHDREWGVPVHDDVKHFEFIVLDAFQAGLNWLTILKKREGFRKAFENYDIAKIATYGEEDYNRLLNDASIIRNRAKIRGTIINAQIFLKVQQEFGSFDKYIWGFVNGKTLKNKWKSNKEIPASTPLSDIISKDLKKRGFKFVGSTIVYAYLQAAGIVNDHIVSCERYSIGRR